MFHVGFTPIVSPLYLFEISSLILNNSPTFLSGDHSLEDGLPPQFHRHSVLSGLILYSLPVHAVQRMTGVSSDTETRETVQKCFQESNSTYSIGFGYGQCPNLIACVMSNLPADISAGMQAGGNIASLVLTIPALSSNI
jgi:hypothetical protein